MSRRVTHKGMHNGYLIEIGEKYISTANEVGWHRRPPIPVPAAWVDGVEAIQNTGLNPVFADAAPLEAMKRYIDRETGLYPKKHSSKTVSEED